MSGKFILTAMMITTGSASASSQPECGRHVPVSAHFFSNEVVREGSGCAVRSNYAFDHAQGYLLSICSGLHGRYRASTQQAVCGGDLGPHKVSEGASDYVEASGICTIEGVQSCFVDAAPTFLGTIHD